jgi:hypothetical protein
MDLHDFPVWALHRARLALHTSHAAGVVFYMLGPHAEADDLVHGISCADLIGGFQAVQRRECLRVDGAGLRVVALHGVVRPFIARTAALLAV